MRVLITGGYGCIGSWIIKNLLDRGDDVWVLDLRENTSRLRLLVDDATLKRVNFLAGDVTDVAALRDHLERQRISQVVHLAALQVPLCRADPLAGARVNVSGTVAVFEAVKALGAQIERLVYASSSAVFAPPAFYEGQRHPLSDTAPLQPGTHYGVFKVCNEGTARIYFQDHGLSSVGLRPGTVYGVARDFGMTSEPTKAVKSVVMGRPWTISYGGRQDFQFADDVAKTFVACLQKPYQGCKVYNLRGTVADIADFYSELCNLAPLATDLIRLGDGRLAISYDFDDAAVQRDFGPLPQTSLCDGIEQTLERFRSLHTAGRLDTTDLEAAVPAAHDDP